MKILNIRSGSDYIYAAQCKFSQKNISRSLMLCCISVIPATHEAEAGVSRIGGHPGKGN
jgi:hypothetical protein